MSEQAPVSHSTNGRYPRTANVRGAAWRAQVSAWSAKRDRMDVRPERITGAGDGLDRRCSKYDAERDRFKGLAENAFTGASRTACCSLAAASACSC
jgi:hypothetical protein